MAIKNIKALFSKNTKPAGSGVVQVTADTTKKVTKKAVVTKTAAPKKTATKKVVAKKAAAKKASVPKVAAKKSVAKKSTPTKVTSKRLVVASDSESFWVSDGQVLNSLVALEAALKTMKPAAYTYHRTPGSNHFAEWVEAVLMDDECARALSQAKTAPAAYRIVALHLKSYGK